MGCYVRICHSSTSVCVQTEPDSSLKIKNIYYALQFPETKLDREIVALQFVEEIEGQKYDHIVNMNDEETHILPPLNGWGSLDRCYQVVLCKGKGIDHYSPSFSL